MRKSLLRAGVAAVAVSALLTIAQPASAHERRTVGNVQTVVGWANEPVFTGFPNAVQFILSDAQGNPITDLGADDVKVEVTFGDKKVGPLAISPAFRVGSFGEPGDYQADLIPSRAGSYSFHFTGTIKGQPFDQTYTSGEETFGSPESPSELEFPEKDPSNAELAEKISAVEAKAGDSGDSGDGSSSSSPLPLILSIVALALAAASFAKSRKSA